VIVRSTDIGAALRSRRPARQSQRGFIVNPFAFGAPAPTDPDFANVSLLVHFDTGNSTTIPDNSANAYVPASGSMSTVSTQSKFGGKAGECRSGFNDCLSYTHTSALDLTTGNFTIEVWVHFSSLTGTQTLVTKSTGTGLYPYNIRKEVTTNKFAAYFFNTGGSLLGPITGTTTATTGVWYHIAVTRNGNTFTLWVNGVSEGTPLTSSAALRTVSGDPLWVGNYGGSSSGLIGYLDDLRITKGVARYTSTFSPPSAAFPNS
jgi:hypothetical protein